MDKDLQDQQQKKIDKAGEFLLGCSSSPLPTPFQSHQYIYIYVYCRTIWNEPHFRRSVADLRMRGSQAAGRISGGIEVFRLSSMS